MFGKCKSTESRWSANKWCTIFTSCTSFSHSRKINTPLTASNHDASTSEPEETCSFYWYNVFMHKCSKRCQLHVTFGKSNALNNILCLWTKFKCRPCSNSAVQFAIKPSECIKKHSCKCAIACTRHPHENVRSAQNTFLGTSNTHVEARKAC